MSEYLHLSGSCLSTIAAVAASFVEALVLGAKFGAPNSAASCALWMALQGHRRSCCNSLSAEILAWSTATVVLGTGARCLPEAAESVESSPAAPKHTAEVPWSCSSADSNSCLAGTQVRSEVPQPSNEKLFHYTSCLASVFVSARGAAPSEIS